MAGHTRGPWSYDGRFTVTIPHASGDLHFRVMPEDAPLIAAAPELLDALIVAKGTLEIACGTTAPYIQVALAIIGAAIAKATAD